MSRTTPSKPLDDPGMWRRLIAASHPDRNGDHDLCVWTQALRERICTGTADAGHARQSHRPPPKDNRDRVPFQSNGNFGDLTRRALGMADEVPAAYGQLLRLLADCYQDADFAREQERGASYKRLAAIGHAAGMNKSQRVRWYRLAESLPLSDRHAGHILARLKREAS